MRLPANVETGLRICRVLMKLGPSGPRRIAQELRHNSSTIRSLCWRMVQAGVLDQPLFRVFQLKVRTEPLTLLDVWEACDRPITLASTDAELDRVLVVVAEHVRLAMQQTRVTELVEGLDGRPTNDVHKGTT